MYHVHFCRGFPDSICVVYMFADTVMQKMIVTTEIQIHVWIHLLIVG